MKKYGTWEFWLTLILLLATAIASIATCTLWYNLTFFVGPYLFIHWLGLVATALVVIAVPIHFFLKRKRPQNSRKILKIHTIGNLFAFLLISLHFAQNIGRLAGAFERLGTGFSMYLILSLIVAAGIIERYRTDGKSMRYIKVIHKYSVIILFLVILIHILEGFNLI